MCEDQVARDFSINHYHPPSIVSPSVFIHPLFWSVFVNDDLQWRTSNTASVSLSAVMARSEIDDIFAVKKPTGKVVIEPTASTSTCTDGTSSKRKRKNKKRKRSAEETHGPGVDEEKPQKKRVVETIHDPSTSSSKGGKGISTMKSKPLKKEKEGLERFRDSRGTGPREWGFSRQK